MIAQATPPAPQPSAPDGSILARTARAAGWVVAWRMATRLLGFGSTLVLVRLLSPADFGLVAMATAFALAIDSCTEIGVEEQIIRTPAPWPALYHTAFTLNLLRLLLVGGTVVALAGPAARFLGDARLEAVLVALGVLTAISGLENVGVVDFRRDMTFEKEFRLLLLPRLLSVAATITAAFIIPGHWALVLGIAVGRIGRVVASYALHPMRPRLTLSAWRDLAGVSFWTWAIGMAAMLRDRCDTFIIGRLLGPAKVGIFAAGAEIATLPATELVEPVCRACFPGFAASAREGASLPETYRRVAGLTVLLALPMGLGLSLVANDLVLLAYGPAWIEAATVVTLLGLTTALGPLSLIAQVLLNAQAMLRRFFAIILASTIVRVGLLLLLTWSHGLWGAALGMLLAMLFEQLLTVGLTLGRVGLTLRPLLGAVARPFVAAAVMAGLLWPLGLGWAGVPASAGEAVLDLLRAVPLGAAAYVGTVGLLWLLAGRPAASAEQDMLSLLLRLGGGLAARLRTRAAVEAPKA